MTTLANRERFESEASRLRPMLHRVALSITGSEDDADDVAQETLLKLWFLRERLHLYASVDALARVIARNLSLNVVRNRRVVVAYDSAQMPEVADAEYTEPDLPDDLMQAISALPDTENAVLRMKHIEGMEVDEIARLIQSTPGAVRTALSRARQRIRKLYTHDAKSK